jgi:hypothetical protein
LHRCTVPRNVVIDLGPDLDDPAIGRDKEGLPIGELHLLVGHNRDAVGIDDLVVRVGEEFEADGILRAPGLMIFYSVDTHTEDDGVQGVILRDVTLEAVGLKSAALGLVLWIEVEDDPLTFVVCEADRLVFLRGQGEVGFLQLQPGLCLLLYGP